MLVIVGGEGGGRWTGGFGRQIARAPMVSLFVGQKLRALVSAERRDDLLLGGRSSALHRALALGGRGPYVVQAAITVLHVDELQDWPQIAALYAELARFTDSPVVELNRAAAIAEAGDAEAALLVVERLELDDEQRLAELRG